MSRKLTRRKFLKGMAVAAGVGALAACQPQVVKETVVVEKVVKETVIVEGAAEVVEKVVTATPVAVLTEPVDIVWWRSLSGAVAEALEDLAKRFSEANELINVIVEFQGSYGEARDKLVAGVAAGVVPDLMLTTATYYKPFARAGVLEPLDDLMHGPDGIDVDDYVPGIERGMMDGKWYELPIAVSTPLFYYNVEMFEAVGLERPVSESWTWDDMFDYVTQATIKEAGETVVHGHAYRKNLWWQECFIWAYGAQICDDDNNVYLDCPEMIDFFTRCQNAFKDGQMHVATSGEGGTFGYFNSKLCASLWASTGSLENMAATVGDTFEWGVAGMPQGPAGRFIATGGSGLVLLRGRSPAHRQASWEFIRWTQQPEQVEFFAKATGYMAHTNSSQALMTDFLAERPKFQIAYQGLACCGRPEKQVAESARAMSLAYDTLNNLVVSEDDVVETLKKLQADIRTIFIEDGLLKA